MKKYIHKHYTLLPDIFHYGGIVILDKLRQDSNSHIEIGLVFYHKITNSGHHLYLLQTNLWTLEDWGQMYTIFLNQSFDKKISK